MLPVQPGRACLTAAPSSPLRPAVPHYLFSRPPTLRVRERSRVLREWATRRPARLVRRVAGDTSLVSCHCTERCEVCVLCSRPAAADGGVPGFGPRIFRRACLPGRTSTDLLGNILGNISLSRSGSPKRKVRGGHHGGTVCWTEVQSCTYTGCKPADSISCVREDVHRAHDLRTLYSPSQSPEKVDISIWYLIRPPRPESP